MLDNEELTAKIIVEQQYEVLIITSYYEERKFNQTNQSESEQHSLPEPFDEALVFDILNQAASLSSDLRRLFYLLLNPLIILLGLLLTTAAFFCVRRDEMTCDRVGHVGNRRLLQINKLVNYYLSLYLLNSLVYLFLVCGLSWLYFLKWGEHISAFSNFSCRAWQLVLHVFHDLSAWILLPPLYAAWCHLRDGKFFIKKTFA